ncbi:MAG: hypothetical protein Tsb0032_16070 [Kiloniellaceae bacterium]
MMRRAFLRARLCGGLVLGAGLSAGLFLGQPGSAAAEDVTVVTSIKPVHSLVAGVMQGAGSPHLIVQGGSSPHSYSLKPSDAAALQRAKVVVWVGEGLETFLESSIATLAEDAVVVELAEVPGLTRLAYREGGPWAEHEHDHDDEHAHEEHDHEEHEHAEHDREEHAHEEHDHEEHAHEGHDHEEAHHDEEHHAEEHHEDEQGHAHGEIDMHLWLDPDNAKAMVTAVAAALTQADPAQAELYRSNAAATSGRLDQLAAEIEEDLAPVKDKPFVVFHDAFQYFDARFGLNIVGSVTVDPERKPGAKRLKEIQEKITDLGARCVFAEPQFEPRLLNVVIEGTQAKTGLLDPLGADLADGPDLYFELMRGNAAALKDCLGETS